MGRKRKSNPKQKSNSPGTSKEIRAVITGFLAQNPNKPFKLNTLLDQMGVRDASSRKVVTQVVFKMEDENILMKSRGGAYLLAEEVATLTGTIDFVNANFAYVVPDDAEEEDVWVGQKDLLGALDDDKVRIRLKRRSHGKKREGEVVEILHRERDEFVGRLEMSTRFGFVIPDFKKMHYDIFVPFKGLHGAEHNDKVIVKLSRFPSKDTKPEGEVVRVLGKAGEHHAEIHSIMAEFGLPFEFPENIEKAADEIPENVTDKEIKKRKDFRQKTTFTIDPFDAKDFDDALSLDHLPNGNVEVGVHIADVTHYVPEGSALDKEAIHRATSVYLVDRTIPMLPERLSNGLCSLRPKEEKLCFSAVFELDAEANVKKQWIGRTIIYSDHRYAYEEAQEELEQQSGHFYQEITELNELSKKLRKRRFQQGAVNFETTEVKFQLAEDGTPLGVVAKERKDVHMLIEEFMLLANKRVAEFVYGKGNEGKSPTFVYRTHDNPDPEKLDVFSKFAARFGYQMHLEKKGISNAINGLLGQIEGNPEQNLLQQLAIRTMAKAKYTTEPKGHFGLSFPHYTHFTSPIRRYPDMMVHRLLQHYLDSGKSADKEAFEELCLHSSEREKRAADAERASIKYKQVEFVQLSEEKVFEGLVSGVTEWGVFVEMTATKCEGMVRLSSLEDDFYEFDEQNYRIIGRNNKRMISLGDKLTVRVVGTDIDRRTIDLIFVDHDN